MKSVLEMNLLASHTMPNMLVPLLYMLYLWTAAPITLSAVVGSRIGRSPFKWGQFGRIFLGTLVGLIAVVPLAFVSVSVFNLSLGFGPRSLPFGGIFGGFFASWIAWKVAGPGPPQPVMRQQVIPPED